MRSRCPTPRRSFDVASIAFGIRNVDDPKRCLEEMARVVKPKGRVVVLEFGQPKGLFGSLYRFYSSVLMPRIGGAAHGQPERRFKYLPRTAAAVPVPVRSSRCSWTIHRRLFVSVSGFVG